jgi:hypothetical protein
MVKGILADVNTIGYVEALVQQMQAERWADFWSALGLLVKRFEEVGLAPESSDLEIWQTCQAEQLILITDNRNQDSPDSLEAAIHQHNQPDCLPVFTIADLNKFRKSRDYVERVVESLYDYLLRIDEVRGSGRLYLP